MSIQIKSSLEAYCNNWLNQQEQQAHNPPRAKEETQSTKQLLTNFFFAPQRLSEGPFKHFLPHDPPCEVANQESPPAALGPASATKDDTSSMQELQGRYHYSQFNCTTKQYLEELLLFVLNPTLIANDTKIAPQIRHLLYSLIVPSTLGKNGNQSLTQSCLEIAIMLILALRIYTANDRKAEIEEIKAEVKSGKFQQHCAATIGNLSGKKLAPAAIKIAYSGGPYFKIGSLPINLINFGHEALDSDEQPIKNQLLRQSYSSTQLKQEKEAAHEYFKQIRDQLRTNFNQAERKELIVQIITFKKLCNASQRELCNAQISFKDLVASAQPLFKKLGLTEPAQQLEFVHFTIIQGIRWNSGIWVKRVFSSVIVIGAGLLVFLPVTTTIMVAILLGSKAALCSGIGAIVIYFINYQSLVAFVRNAIALINSGDRLNSYTKLMEEDFVELLKLYDTEPDEKWYQAHDYHLTRSNFKQHQLWQFTPDLKLLNEYLNDFGIQEQLNRQQQIRNWQTILQIAPTLGVHLRQKPITHWLEHIVGSQPAHIQHNTEAAIDNNSSYRLAGHFISTISDDH